MLQETTCLGSNRFGSEYLNQEESISAFHNSRIVHFTKGHLSAQALWTTLTAPTTCPSLQSNSTPRIFPRS